VLTNRKLIKRALVNKVFRGNSEKINEMVSLIIFHSSSLSAPSDTAII